MRSGFNSQPLLKPIAQWLERSIDNGEVLSSSLSWLMRGCGEMVNTVDLGSVR